MGRVVTMSRPFPTLVLNQEPFCSTKDRSSTWMQGWPWEVLSMVGGIHRSSFTAFSSIWSMAQDSHAPELP